MATIKKPLTTLSIIGIFTFILFILAAQAEQSMDMITCSSATLTTIVESEELTIMSFESKGINFDNMVSKTFDNMTVQAVGLYKIDKGKFTGNFYSKYMDPSGDFFVVEVSQVGMDRDWKYIYGMGKWKGITGGGKASIFTRAKPISPGTSQNCTKITGTYELKK